MTLRKIVVVLASLAFAVTLVPVLAFAQSFNYQNNCGTGANNWFPYYNNSTNTNCTQGNLLVYVQVSSNLGYANSVSPSSFTVTVSGVNPAPSSFSGSLSGTEVLVGGSYSVQADQLAGYTPSYSAGCNGTLSNNASGECIITESNTDQYTTYPNTYYPNQYYPSYYPGYNYYSAPLTCSPSGETVTIGQNVTFTAAGGDVSQFNWSDSQVPNSTSYNIGRTYSATFLSPGTAIVTVMNDQQSATCTVNVVGYPITGYNPGGPINLVTPSNTFYPTATAYPVTVTPTYIPALPNTGFAPLDPSELAIVLAFLIAAALVAYPYVRQAFAIVLR